MFSRWVNAVQRKKGCVFFPITNKKDEPFWGGGTNPRFNRLTQAFLAGRLRLYLYLYLLYAHTKKCAFWKDAGGRVFFFESTRTLVSVNEVDILYRTDWLPESEINELTHKNTLRCNAWKFTYRLKSRSRLARVLFKFLLTTWPVEGPPLNAPVSHFGYPKIKPEIRSSKMGNRKPWEGWHLVRRQAVPW